MGRSCSAVRFSGGIDQPRGLPGQPHPNYTAVFQCAVEQRKQSRRSVALVEPIIEGALESPDGYWRVEVVKFGPRQRWFRVLHAATVVEEKASLATVQRIVGDAYGTLSPVGDGENGVA